MRFLIFFDKKFVYIKIIIVFVFKFSSNVILQG